MRHLFCFLALATFLAACDNQLPYQKYLNADQLPVESFVVDNNRDTVLRTKKGATITIAKGSFNKEQVRLELKEAYSLKDIVKAGLTTTSGGKPLSSGGMLKLSSPDRELKFQKAISIATPADRLEPGMKLYKGDEVNGVIDWVDPQPLKDSASPWLQAGKQVFQQNCASCHTLDKHLSGPALRGVEERGPWTNRDALICFTKNPAAFIPKSSYAQDLQKTYGQIMPGFPGLTRQSLHALYDYIQAGGDVAVKGFATYQLAERDLLCDQYDSLKQIYAQLQGEWSQQPMQERIQWKTDFGTPDTNGDSSVNTVVFPTNDPNKVEPEYYKAERYQFDVQSFGWYNVDKLYELNVPQTELTVTLNGPLREKMNVFIAIPTYKIFYLGGETGMAPYQFAFSTRDGFLPLPLGSEVLVFAIGEKEDQVVFDFKQFVSSSKQDIQLTPAMIDASQFNAIISRLLPNGVDVTAKKNTTGPSATERNELSIKLEEIKKMLKEGSHCECFPKADTSYQL